MKNELNEIKEIVPDNTAQTQVQRSTSPNGVSNTKEITQELINEMNEDIEDLEKKEKKERRRKNAYKVGLVVAIIIIIILLLRGCSSEKSLVDNTKIPELETAGLVEQDIPVEEEKRPGIDIPYIQSFIVTKEYPYKDLYNPETNKGNYYLQFSFTLVGEEEPFYQSKMVEAGHKFSVNIADLLEVGEYQVNVRTDTFTEDTLEPMSGDMHMINITVAE